jgi:hypothetical protein
VIFFAWADYLIIWMSCLLIGTVTDLALAMEEHRAAYRIAGLALVQSPAWPCWRKSGSDSQ